MSSFENLDDLRERNKQLLARLREQRKRLQRLTTVATDPGSPGPGEIRRRPTDESRYSSVSPVGSVVTDIGGRQGLARAAVSKPKTLVEDHKPAVSREKAQDVSKTSTMDKDIVPLEGPAHRNLQDERNIRLGRERKSEAMTSGLVFRSVVGEQHNGDSLVPRSTEPLLGYDWIAGLLDADGSLDDRTDQFFAELHNFRQVNKEECIHSPNTWVERDEISPPSLLTDEKAMECEPETHKCMFRYRINSRLFPTPLDCQAACPVCMMPKSQHPQTVAEPAIVRVSVPCAVLLPAYRHRAHHRCSFNPSDSLGLSSVSSPVAIQCQPPTEFLETQHLLEDITSTQREQPPLTVCPQHCLPGWSRSAPVADLPSSLDLRSCLDKVLPETSLILSSLVQSDEDHQ